MKKLKQLVLMMLILFSISCTKEENNTPTTGGGGGEDDPITLKQTFPLNSAQDITINAILKWEGNAEGYDIYFDTNYPPELKVNTSTVTVNEFELSELKNDTKYYWKVVAKTGDDTIESSMWSFTTVKPDIVTWEQRLGGTTDESLDMIELTDGGLIVMARESWEQPHVTKLDKNGNVVWDKYYSDLEDPSGANGNTLLKNFDGGFFILHKLASFSYSLEKFSNEGVNIGSISIETTHGHINSIVQTEDGGFALAGGKSELSYNSDLWFAKTDNSGTIIWDKILGQAYYTEVAFAIIETQDGGFAITGKTEVPNLSFAKDNIWLIKTDGVGNVIWDKTYGGDEDDEGRVLVEKTNGELVLGCNTNSRSAGETDIWIYVIDLEGHFDRETFGGTENDRIGDIVLTETGGIVVSSNTRSETAGCADVWLFELDDELDMAWEMKYGGSHSDAVKSLVGTQDGGYAMTATSMNDIDPSIWIIKTDEEGIVREN
ncbi:MAG: hypothetical protein IMY72_01820 [Bacteroidetes bacterium]|nr:hypothetical protein [Bacteroidota bacterium]